MKQLLLLSVLCMLFSCASTPHAVPVKPEVQDALNSFQSAWNSDSAEALVKVLDPDYYKYAASTHKAMAEQYKGTIRYVDNIYKSWVKAFGTIENIRVQKFYEEEKYCYTRVDFQHYKDFPVVFWLSTSEKKKRVGSIMAGQDPTSQLDSALIVPFLTAYMAAWNNKDGLALSEMNHPLNAFPREIKQYEKKVDAKEATASLSFWGHGLFGAIKGFDIKAYKPKTSEYIVDFEYTKAGNVMATVNIQKDSVGEWKLFGFNIDDGKLALDNFDDWDMQ